jgi:hypothetical protein
MSFSQDLSKQFLAFYNSHSIFEKSYDEFELFKLYQIDEGIDFDDLQINEKIPLGKRVERFFEYYVNLSNEYEIKKSNIQIIKDKNTLGELDFILYNKVKKYFEHIELVYKYYLYDDRFKNEWDRYIGPNRDDTFVKKLNKLKEKQFPLLFNDETQKYLRNIPFDNIKQKACFMANIYLPLHLKGKKLPFINNDCIKGYYINYEEFLQSKEYKSYEYFMPHRYEWILDASTCEVWKDYKEIKIEIDFFMNLKKSPLLWLKNKNKFENIFITWW